jgi:hypothetical protein
MGASMTRQRPIDDNVCVADSDGLNPYGREPVQAIMRHGLRVTFFQRRTYTSPFGPTTFGPPRGGGGFRVTRARLLDMARAGGDVVFVWLPSNVGYAADANRGIDAPSNCSPKPFW